MELSVGLVAPRSIFLNETSLDDEKPGAVSDRSLACVPLGANIPTHPSAWFLALVLQASRKGMVTGLRV